MQNYGLIACFSPVIKVDIGEQVQWELVRKNWELENGKKWGFGDPKSS